MKVDGRLPRGQANFDFAMPTSATAREQLAKLTDPEVVVLAQQGKEAAYRELLTRYERPVFSLIFRMVRDRETAEDLAQETFVRAYRALERFRVGEPLYPWLSRITMNLAFSLHRYRKRRPETSIEPLVEAGQQWGVDDDPAEHAAASEQRERMQAAFAELSEEHQAVLGLRVLQDMSYEQIATTLNVPVGTVMSRLSRARVELRRRMAERSGEGAQAELRRDARRGEAS